MGRQTSLPGLPDHPEAHPTSRGACTACRRPGPRFGPFAPLEGVLRPREGSAPSAGARTLSLPGMAAVEAPTRSFDARHHPCAACATLYARSLRAKGLPVPASLAWAR